MGRKEEGVGEVAVAVAVGSYATRYGWHLYRFLDFSLNQKLKAPVRSINFSKIYKKTRSPGLYSAYGRHKYIRIVPMRILFIPCIRILYLSISIYFLRF